MAEKKQISIFEEDMMDIPEDVLDIMLERINEEKEKREEARRDAEELDLSKTHIDEVTSMDLPLDWSNFYDEEGTTAGVQVESISDGLMKCLNTLGVVDIEYISSITGKDYKTVIETLKGSIYQNPDTWGECFYQGWETADEYLSGNVAQKLQSAIESNRDYNGYFQANVDALKAILPKGISTDEIYITLGSPWVPTHVISEFIMYTRSGIVDRDYAERFYTILHDEMTGTWEYRFKPYSSNRLLDQESYGTKRRDFYDILMRTLNMQSVAVYDRKKSLVTKSGVVSVLNKEETVLALEKQKLIIERFQKWVWTDKDRKKELLDIYQKKYLSLKQRHFSGKFLEFPNMNPNVQLFPYQKDAVARILFTPNTLLAHDVGSGKTYAMIAAGMELRRMKQADRVFYVVPNNIIGQWKNIFLEMYPEARLLCVEAKNFTPAKRQACLEEICEMEYDGILMTYSCFNEIPISNACRVQMLDLEIQKLWDASRIQGKGTDKIKRQITKLQNLRAELAEEPEKEGICFDQLGVSRLFVDEAHNFKNVPIETKIDNVMGISKTGSKKCQDMMDKVRIVQSQNGGKGVVFATGTPITNSITDAYIMQSYLQSGQLTLLELQSFDSWVGMFAECATNFEIDVDTSTYRLATRFCKFHNLPELTTLLAGIADFHQMDGGEGVPTHDGYTDVLVSKTVDFSKYLKSISERADRVRNGHISRTEDNMLKITTDGRKAALDLRLVDKMASFTAMSKVFSCAQYVSMIYKKTQETRSTQLVFCDSSTPKEGFNVYDELKHLLMRMGVKEEEIAYIHQAATEAKRSKLFDQVRKGEIRVLIGSTFKLGLGVNVQDKLIAVHHLDVPWRPADMVQREGRILRQGNENTKVELYRYITEGSFDAYSWQLLETKQRFISDLLSGSVETRNEADVDDTVLSYAEVKALAVGSPLMRERVETANELSRYQILQRKLVNNRMQYEKELKDLPKLIERLEDLIPKCEADADFAKANKQEYEAEERREIRQMIYSATHTEEPTKAETVVTTYQGFQVVVPARVSTAHPVILLRRLGEYSVELTGTELGGMMRIDRTIEDLPKRLEDLKKRLKDSKTRQAFMEAELAKKEDYVDKIEALKAHIETIDEKLGVKKDE